MNLVILIKLKFSYKGMLCQQKNPDITNFRIIDTFPKKWLGLVKRKCFLKNAQNARKGLLK